MADDDILSRISELVAEEHHLTGTDGAADRRLQIEERLDQCWGPARQRQRREFGDDPSQAHAQPSIEVERYQQ